MGSPRRQTSEASALARRLRRASALRPRLPDVVPGSLIVDRHAGPVIRRLLRIVKDPRRSAALAARLGVPLWGDRAQRFDLLFIEREPRDTWLRDESGKRIVWLGAGEAIELATLTVRGNFLRLANERVAERRVARLQRRLREIAADAQRPPKPPGRPAGRTDQRRRQRRLADAKYDRATHTLLADALSFARARLRWNGAQLLAETERNSPAALGLFRGQPNERVAAALQLLATLVARPAASKVLRRVVRDFRSRA